MSKDRRPVSNKQERKEMKAQRRNEAKRSRIAKVNGQALQPRPQPKAKPAPVLPNEAQPPVAVEVTVRAQPAFQISNVCPACGTMCKADRVAPEVVKAMEAKPEEAACGTCGQRMLLEVRPPKVLTLEQAAALARRGL